MENDSSKRCRTPLMLISFQWFRVCNRISVYSVHCCLAQTDVTTQSANIESITVGVYTVESWFYDTLHNFVTWSLLCHCSDGRTLLYFQGIVSKFVYRPMLLLFAASVWLHSFIQLKTQLIKGQQQSLTRYYKSNTKLLRVPQASIAFVSILNFSSSLLYYYLCIIGI